MRKIIQNLVSNISNQSSDLERSFSGLAVKCYAEGELARDCPNPEDICYTKREFFELFAIFGLSIGVIFNDKPIQGSCGGIGADESCTICGGDTEKCDSFESV